jgi:hypothetical protein
MMAKNLGIKITEEEVVDDAMLVGGEPPVELREHDNIQ